MIWKTVIAALGVDDEVLYHPPKRIVELEVIAGIAHLTMYDINEGTGTPTAKPTAAIEVPAKALLHALKAAVSDDEEALPAALQRPGRSAD